MEFLSSNPALRAVVVSKAPNLPLAPATGVGEMNWYYALLFGLMTVTLLGFLWISLNFVRRWRRLFRRDSYVLVLSVIWILPFAVFTIWLSPLVSHHWMPDLPVLWLLAALVLKDAIGRASSIGERRKAEGLVVLWLAAFFALNFFGSILPAHDPATNWNRNLALRLQNTVAADDLVIALELGDYKHAPPYIRYYNRALVLGARGIFFPSGTRSASGSGLAKEAVISLIREWLGRGRSVYVLADVFDSDTGYAHLARYKGWSVEQVGQELRSLFQDYRLRIVLESDGRPLVYQVVVE